MSMPTSPAASGLNRDYERRPYWHATMPTLPSRRDRQLPDVADVVVIGGGYTGINAARTLARGGASVTLIETEQLGFGGSTRNGGIVHPGYKWGPQELIDRYGEETGRALFAETMAAYDLVKRLIADEAITCEFRECGYLDLAWAPSHVDELRSSVETLRRFGIETTFVTKADLGAEIGSTFYHGGLVFPPSGLLHPGKYFAGLVGAAERAGADLHEGVRATSIRRQADGRLVVETTRGAILTKEVVVGTNGYTDGVVPSLRRRIIPIGSYIIATEPLPEELARTVSPRGRAFFDTKNFLYYWHVSEDRRMIFGGRASFLPTNVDHTAAILHKGMLRGAPAARRLSRRVRLGRQRRVHLRPHAACRAEGRDHLRDGLLRDRRRPDDGARNVGRRVAGRRPGAGALEALVPARAGPLRGPAMVPAVRG